LPPEIGCGVCGVRALLLAGLLAAGAMAHVGSPDVFFQGKAGPYPLLVAIRPPDVIPGVARIEVRVDGADVDEVDLTPTPMTGIAATHPPIADVARRAAGDPQFFEGALWLMSSGSWEVHIRVRGTRGSGELPVPVPAVALKMKPMGKGVGAFLVAMTLFLSVGMVAIVRAAVETRKNFATVVAGALVGIALWGGWVWWGSDAVAAGQKIYKPLSISAWLDGDRLDLKLADPGWLALRKLDDLVPDHGHLMHLFLVRWPAMDRVYHLHPEQTATGYFETVAPAIPRGTYRIYGDIVHDSGLAETAVGEVSLPDVAGKEISGDDAVGPSLPRDGYRMVWVHDPKKPIAATKINLFSFEIVGPDGKPVNDLEPYMGMGGHAEFIKDDGSVFAHVHPTGSVPMASVNVASPAAMMAMHEMKPGPVVSFPYGIPTAGKYRVFVQMKRAGRVETGEFEVTVI
jgi:hypothetical protein